MICSYKIFIHGLVYSGFTLLSSKNIQSYVFMETTLDIKSDVNKKIFDLIYFGFIVYLVEYTVEIVIKLNLQVSSSYSGIDLCVRTCSVHHDCTLVDTFSPIRTFSDDLSWLEDDRTSILLSAT